MDRPEHNNVNFFLGLEVEHTPAHGQKTLFVIGIQPVEKILELAERFNVGHIYFGANQSFPRLDVNDGDGWRPWESMVQDCLNRGYLCTLDLDVSCVEGLTESMLVEYNNFIPMISVKLPYIQVLGYNATIKLDDKDFRATNPGVWCHSLHDLKDRKLFTDWSKYTKDRAIEE